MTKPCDFTAASIYKLLEAKHSKDVIIPECKDGPTHGAQHSRLDAWAMARSWANPLMTGYEIKISRSDFLQDRKWTNYLCLCNEFYFVCPWGLIGVHEVPDDAGLMWVSKSLSRVYTKKKAPYRNIEPPTALMTYLIMNYCSTSCNMGNGSTSNRKYWTNWLKEKMLDRELGYRVGHALSKKINDKIRMVQRENDRLKAQNEKYEKVKIAAEKLGLDLCNLWNIDGQLMDAAKTIKSLNNGHLKKNIVAARDLMNKAYTALETIALGDGQS